MFLHGFVTYRQLISITAAVVAVILSLPVYADEQPVTKTLTVMEATLIRGENIEAARNQAIKKSLESAVSLLTMNQLPIETLLNNFQLINRLLYKQTDRFILDYKVLTESKSEKIYSVLVQATVSLEGLEEHFSNAGIMFGRKALPKILLLIAEKNLHDISPQYWWSHTFSAVYKGFAESAMKDVMKQKGFIIIDPNVSAVNMEIDSDIIKPDLTNKEAIDIGHRVQAGVVVIGRSLVHQTDNTMIGNIRSFKGLVTARAVRTDTGEEIASSMQTAVTANADEFAGGRDALSSAGSLSGDELASLITTAWHRGLNLPTLVEIFVKGTGKLPNFEIFRRILTEVPGVKEIQVKEIKTDEALIVVDFEGSAERLAAALMLKDFDSFGINISEISRNHLKIHLVQG